MSVKIIFCWSILVFFNVQALNEEFVRKEWIKFQVQYGKNYRSLVEKRSRYSIFAENLEKIVKQNALYDEGKSSHMVGINQFTDWTSEEFLVYLSRGWENEPKIWGDTFHKTEGLDTPVYVDWRNKSAVTGVKNQGMCGSSWSFSATGAIEGQLGIKGNLFSLSEQNLIDCSPGSGCRGGSPNIAFDYVRRNGIESEVSYPYIGADGSCAAESSSVVTKISNIVKIPSNDEEALQDAIASVGPISVAIDATESLQRYRAGILDDKICRNDTQNHAVLVVGYGRENNSDYYIIKNCWGDDWGEQGYFRLSRNKNMCGIASTASYPVL